MNHIDTFKSARRAGCPIVVIRTPDYSATIREITKANEKFPILKWDVCRGALGINSPGESASGEINGGVDPAITTGNPVEALQLALAKAPKGTILFMVNAGMFLEVPDSSKIPFIQGISNVRDAFKSSQRTLVLIGPDVKLPPELSNDSITIDVALPPPEKLAEISTGIHKAGEVKPPSAEDQERIVAAVRGLSSFSAEQVLAMALTQQGMNIPMLWDQKRAIIERAGGLKVSSSKVTFDSLGGLDTIKGFAKMILGGRKVPKLVVLIDEIEKQMAGLGDSNGINQDAFGQLLAAMQNYNWSGMLLPGFPGCLAGDTKILYSRGERTGSNPIKLALFCKKFNEHQLRGRPGPAFTPGLTTRVHSMSDDGVIFYNEVVAVFESGIKPLVKVTLEDGRVLRATPDHPVMTPDGFIGAGDLGTDHRVICRGSMAAKGSGGRKLGLRPDRVVVTTKYHPLASQKIVNGCLYQRIHKARLVMEALMNGVSYDRFVYALSNSPADCARFSYLPLEVEVHHVDENPMNDHPDNLAIMTHRGHARLHGKFQNFGTEYIRELKVVSVVSQADEMTYDIQMADPVRNFCANGIVVHNTGKTEFANALGNEAGGLFVQMDLGATKGSLVGQSEKMIRNAIQMLYAMGGEDVMFVGTCNSMAGLRPELKRRFGHGTFFFDLPNVEEVIPIWNIYRNRFELGNDEIPDCSGWTGAEIRKCSQLAWELRIPLKKAAEFITPVAKIMGDEADKLRASAHMRYLSASKPGLYQRQTTKADIARVIKGGN